MFTIARFLFRDVPVLGGLLLAGLGLAAGWWLRYDLIEPVARGVACGESALPPWWCAPRIALILTVHALPAKLALSALGVAVWTLSPGALVRLLAFIVVFAGGAGLILYMTGAAAVAALLGLLRLVGLEKASGEAPGLGGAGG